MTGWRLGWVVLPPGAVRGFEKLAQHLFIAAPSAAQHAACAAFGAESLELLEHRRSEFARRRDFLLPELRAAGLGVPAEPRGAFYVYADCGTDARAWCLELLDREGVAATPGVDFGANGTERFVRFAYTRGMAELAEAARRLRRFARAAPSA
jgi:aspartate/methionine/tyrosine aminotransferase